MQTKPQSKKLNFGNPFHHPVIVSILREEFFQKANSFGKMHPKLFVSSHKSRSEPELPEPMVALVATAVRAFFYIIYIVELNAALIIRFTVPCVNGILVNAKILRLHKLPLMAFIKAISIHCRNSRRGVLTSIIVCCLSYIRL
jgi:hypothetical protein